MFSPDKSAIVAAVGEPVYQNLRWNDPKPWQTDLCNGWTMNPLPPLSLVLERESDAMTITHSVRSKPVDHHFISVDDYTGDPLIIDGTWQQFLPENLKSEEEKVLVSRKSAVTKVLQAAGVSTDMLLLWDAPIANQADDRVYWRKRTRF